MNPAERAGVAAWPPGAPPPDRGSQGKPSGGFTDLLDEMKARTADAEGQQSKAGDTRCDQDADAAGRKDERLPGARARSGVPSGAAATLATVGVDSAALMATGVITSVPTAAQATDSQNAGSAAAAAVGDSPARPSAPRQDGPGVGLAGVAGGIASDAQAVGVAAPTQEELAQATVTIGQAAAEGNDPVVGSPNGSTQLAAGDGRIAETQAASAQLPGGETSAAGSTPGAAAGSGQTVQDRPAAGTGQLAAAEGETGLAQSVAQGQADAASTTLAEASGRPVGVSEQAVPTAPAETSPARGGAASTQGQTLVVDGQTPAGQGQAEVGQNPALAAGDAAHAEQAQASVAPGSTQVPQARASVASGLTQVLQAQASVAPGSTQVPHASAANAADQAQAGEESPAAQDPAAVGQGKDSSGPRQGAGAQDSATAAPDPASAGQELSTGTLDSGAAQDQGRAGRDGASTTHGQPAPVSTAASQTPAPDEPSVTQVKAPTAAVESADHAPDAPATPVETTAEQTATAQETLSDAQRSAGAVVAPTTARRFATRAAYEAAPLHRAVESTEAMLRLVARRGVTQASLSLRPAELGAVEVRLRATADGVVASVAADSSQAAKLLEQHAGDLRRALEDSGVRLLRLDIAWSRDPRTGTGAGGDRDGTPSHRGDAADPVNPTASEPDSTTTVVQLPNGVLVDVLA